MRFEVKNGADLIKLSATAGVLSEEDSVGAPQFSQEEMNVVVQEANMWGRRVAAHAHGAEGIKRAVRAGVNSIEHGSLIDDEGIRLMKQRGTYLVADIYNDDYILCQSTHGSPIQRRLSRKSVWSGEPSANFQKAAKAGVRWRLGRMQASPAWPEWKQLLIVKKWG